MPPFANFASRPRDGANRFVMQDWQVHCTAYISALIVVIAIMILSVETKVHTRSIYRGKFNLTGKFENANPGKVTRVGESLFISSEVISCPKCSQIKHLRFFCMDSTETPQWTHVQTGQEDLGARSSGRYSDRYFKRSLKLLNETVRCLRDVQRKAWKRSRKYLEER